MNLIRRVDPEPGLGPDRRWKVLPVPSAHENPFHGAQILEEVGGSLGLLLWQRVRDVVLWSNFLPLGGGGLFVDDASAVATNLTVSIDPALTVTLPTLQQVVTEGDRVAPHLVAAACSDVREWALARSLFWTAAYYAEAAAAARPLDPMLAVYAGRVARAQAHFPRATQWFQRAIGLARRSENWDTYTIAWLGLAKLELMRGRIPKARRHLIRAWKSAVEHRLWDLGAEARHDLMVLEFEAGRLRLTAEHAESALRLYPDGAPNIPALAHDWAYLWATQGYYPLALPVLECALPFITSAGARVLALSSIAWAAAAMGDVRRYRSAKEALLQHFPLAPDQTATAMVNLARGAMVVEGTATAVELARRARDLARGREEASVVTMAEKFLFDASGGLGGPVQVEPPPDGHLQRIAATLIERIRRSAAGR